MSDVSKLDSKLLSIRNLSSLHWESLRYSYKEMLRINHSYHHNKLLINEFHFNHNCDFWRLLVKSIVNWKWKAEMHFRSTETIDGAYGLTESMLFPKNEWHKCQPYSIFDISKIRSHNAQYIFIGMESFQMSNWAILCFATPTVSLSYTYMNRCIVNRVMRAEIYYWD